MAQGFVVVGSSGLDPESYYKKTEMETLLTAYRKRRGPIPNKDFNEATEEGVYTYVNSVQNGYAEQAAGTLEVYNNNNNGASGSYGTWIYQMAHPVNGEAPFFRTRTDTNDWTPWQQLLKGDTGTLDSIASRCIVASGSNYIRLIDGTQICAVRFDISVSQGATYENTVAFPVPFAARPYTTMGSYWGWGQDDFMIDETNTTVGIRILNCSNNQHSENLIAFGRWK